jgi:hypothetical protein
VHQTPARSSTKAYASCIARPNWRKSTLHKLVIGALGTMVVMFSSAAFAQGTATEVMRCSTRLLSH